MNLQTYLMIKEANESTGNTANSKHLSSFGLSNVGPLHKKRFVLPGGVFMGTTPWGETFTVDGPPIVINRNITNNNNGVQKVIKSTLGTIGTSGPVRYR